MVNMTEFAGEVEQLGITGASMTTTTLSAANHEQVRHAGRGSTEEVYNALIRLSRWLEKNDYRGYDTFDGLNAKFVRPLTFETSFLRIVLQQGVRRFPFNLRPLLGISKERSTQRPTSTSGPEPSLERKAATRFARAFNSA